MSKLQTTGYGWAKAYHENDLDDLPLGYIKKVEATRLPQIEGFT